MNGCPQKSGTTIYIIRNNITGKLYIGQTSQPLLRRWYQHCHDAKSGSKRLLARSIRKHGKENFSINKLVTYAPEHASYWEETWIRLLKTHIKGYNISTGGSAPFRGAKHTEEWKRKHSEAMTGEKHPLWGKKHSPETIAKIKATRKRVFGKENQAYRQDVPASAVMVLFASGMKRKDIADLFDTDRKVIRRRLKENSHQQLEKEIRDESNESRQIQTIK
jgi:group I intron endonuclease